MNLQPQVVEQIAESDRIVGIKDTSGSIGQISELIRRVGGKIAVLGGTTDVILPTLGMGGKGALIGMANVIPKMCSELYDHFMAGRMEKARELQLKMLPLNDVLFKKYNPTTVKEAMTMLGIPAGYPRRPMLPLPEEEKAEIRNVLKNMKLLN